MSQAASNSAGPKLSARVRAVRRSAARWRSRHLLRASFEVLTVAAFIVCLSGFARGPEPDQIAGAIVRAVQSGLRRWLAGGWVHPAIAEAVVVVMTFTGFATLALGLAWLVRRVPAYVGFLVLAEFHRRQGHKLSALELLLGISLPIALVLALACKSTMSLYACTYFVLGYAYVRMSSDVARLESTLNWYVRIRTGIDTSIADHDDADDDH